MDSMMKKICSIIVALCLLLPITGCTVKPVDTLTDADKFAKEYSVPKNNPFKYVTVEEAIQFLEEGTGIIYFGFPECPWCQASIKILTEALMDKNIKEVYYFNPKEIRENNTEEYQKIVELTKEHLFETAEGEKRLFVPDTYFVLDGKIVGHNNDMSTMSGEVEEYLTEERKEKLKEEYIKLIVKVYSDGCTSC